MSKDPYVCSVRAIHADRVKVARGFLENHVALDSASSLLKMMADPTRIRILQALRAGELCVCDISNALKMSISSISHQLRPLRDGGLVRARRQGRIVFYSLVDAHLEALLDDVMGYPRE